jgi:hypothetical protein
MDKNQNLYEDCLRADGDPKCIEEIKKDIHRQFPTHEMFSSEDKPGQTELFNVLKAYTVQNPKIGYCQAQAPVAAFLLMHMPAVQAFWCLVSISDKYLEDYYSPSMEVVQRDGLILQGLLKKVCPAAYKHLKKVNAEPMFYCTEWFLVRVHADSPMGLVVEGLGHFLVRRGQDLVQDGAGHTDQLSGDGQEQEAVSGTVRDPEQIEESSRRDLVRTESDL